MSEFYARAPSDPPNLTPFRKLWASDVHEAVLHGTGPLSADEADEILRDCEYAEPAPLLAMRIVRAVLMGANARTIAQQWLAAAALVHSDRREAAAIADGSLAEALEAPWQRSG